MSKRRQVTPELVRRLEVLRSKLSPAEVRKRTGISERTQREYIQKLREGQPLPKTSKAKNLSKANRVFRYEVKEKPTRYKRKEVGFPLVRNPPEHWRNIAYPPFNPSQLYRVLLLVQVVIQPATISTTGVAKEPIFLPPHFHYIGTMYVDRLKAEWHDFVGEITDDFQDRFETANSADLEYVIPLGFVLQEV